MFVKKDTMEIVNAPARLAFVGNMSDIVFVEVPHAGAAINLFEKGNPEKIIFDEIYMPDAEEKITIDLKSVFIEIIAPRIPELDTFVSTLKIKSYILTTPDDSYTFSVLPGGIDSDEDIFNFLRHNFLTWQQKTRQIAPEAVILLSYIAQEDCLFKIDVTFEDGSVSATTVAIAENDYKSFNISPAFLSGMFKNKIASCTAWIEAYSGYLLTDKNEYNIFDPDECSTYFFLNGLGGFDSISFPGLLKKKIKTETEISYLRTRATEGRIALTKSFQQNTGFLSSDYADIVSEFLTSKKRYLLSGDKLLPIVIENSENEFTSKELNSYNFEYRFSEQHPYIHLKHKESLTLDQLPPFWNKVAFCFDQISGNKIIDRTRGIIATISDNNQITFPPCTPDVMNKDNADFWLSDIPGNGRVWGVSEITGLHTINYATKDCTEVLFFRDVSENKIISVVPIIAYSSPLNDTEIDVVLTYLKEYYFIYDEEDNAVFVDNAPQADNNTFLIDKIKK